MLTTWFVNDLHYTVDTEIHWVVPTTHIDAYTLYNTRDNNSNNNRYFIPIIIIL